jgi:hypothetical protein
MRFGGAAEEATSVSTVKGPPTDIRGGLLVVAVRAHCEPHKDKSPDRRVWDRYPIRSRTLLLSRHRTNASVRPLRRASDGRSSENLEARQYTRPTLSRPSSTSQAACPDRILRRQVLQVTAGYLADLAYAARPRRARHAAELGKDR